MKKLLFTIFLLVCSFCSAQTRPDWLDIKNTHIVDFRYFGAKTTVGFNNAAALASAAAYIQARGGNTTLIIPAGTYSVVPGGAALPEGSRDLWSAFGLSGVDNVSIVGMSGAKFTSSIDMGSASTNGQCMWLFDFANCNNITIENLIVDIAVTGTPNPVADVNACKLAAIVYAHATGEIVEGLKIRGCDFEIYNAVSGNGQKLGYEFITCFVEGDWASPYAYYYTGVDIENNTFRNGQGPEVWFWFTRGGSIKNNRWLDSGGPLYPVRLYPACADIDIKHNYFRRKKQPGEIAGIGHNFVMHSTGGNGGATNSALAADNISFDYNTIITNTGQVAFWGGGDNLSAIGNKVIRPATATETHYAGAFTLGNSAYGETVGSFNWESNSLKNVKRPALYLNGVASSVAAIGNTLQNCHNLVFASSLSWLNDLSITGGVSRDCDSKGVYLSTLATNTANITVTGVTFVNQDESCIYAVSPTSNIYTIEGCHFRSCSASDTAPVVYGLFGSFAVNGNFFRNNYGIDLYLSSSNAQNYVRGATAVGNHFNNCQKTSVFGFGPWLTINSNTIINPNLSEAAGGAGIQIGTGSINVSVQGNTIFSQSAKAKYGIWMASCTQSLAADNILYNSSSISAIATGTSGVTTHDNLY